jgi:hypothetical protein
MWLLSIPCAAVNRRNLPPATRPRSRPPSRPPASCATCEVRHGSEQLVSRTWGPPFSNIRRQQQNANRENAVHAQCLARRRGRALRCSSRLRDEGFECPFLKRALRRREGGGQLAPRAGAAGDVAIVPADGRQASSATTPAPLAAGRLPPRWSAFGFGGDCARQRSAIVICAWACPIRAHRITSSREALGASE